MGLRKKKDVQNIVCQLKMSFNRRDFPEITYNSQCFVMILFCEQCIFFETWYFNFRGNFICVTEDKILEGFRLVMCIFSVDDSKLTTNNRKT